MKCELCGKPIEYKSLCVPVGEQASMDPHMPGRIEPRSKGIHLDCIKEMLEVLRSATLAMAPSTKHQAPTGESNGT